MTMVLVLVGGGTQVGGGLVAILFSVWKLPLLKTTHGEISCASQKFPDSKRKCLELSVYKFALRRSKR